MKYTLLSFFALLTLLTFHPAQAQQHLYGMTILGGKNNAGTFFKCDIDGSQYVVLHDFDPQQGGVNPNGNLTLVGNKLYGMTSKGGVNSSNNGGVIFSYDLTTNNYTVLHEFDSSGNNDGIFPYGSLVLASNGKLYGMTSAGGNSGDGIIFSYDPVNDDYIKTQDFILVNSGSAPWGNLTELNGKLYGMTSAGGGDNLGVIFEYDLSLDKIDQTFEFGQNNGISDGATPFGSLTVFNNKLYGMTSAGGGPNDGGAIFSYDPNLGYTHLTDFDNSGFNPNGSLIVMGTQLYGMTKNGGTLGTLFSFDPANPSTITNLVNFKGTSNGANPLSSLTEFKNVFYGMTQQGGANSIGVAFKYDPAAGTQYSILHEFDDLPPNVEGKYPAGDLIVVDDVVLPVNLNSFTARAEGQNVKIEWATASEQNNDRFEIERSLDGIKFSKMATVSGHGTTSAPQRYIAYDHNPHDGINYYRLMQIDLNGQSADKGTKSVKFSLNQSQTASLQVSPNPVTSSIKFKLNNYTGKEVKAVLTTTSGKILHKETVQVNAENTLNFTLTPGSYILKVSGERGLNLSNVVLAQ